jgi:NAD(P)-dependent dehydrogenase (short-subunit alcohol dehydrogenase family)
MGSYTRNTTAEEVAEDCRLQIAGKCVLVTGVSPGGLGAEFVTVIAKHKPACIILATRDLTTAHEIVGTITTAAPDARIWSIKLDLASLAQVRVAAEEINSLDEDIDVIVNNAAIGASPYARTVDGFERCFATNHLGPFLLTNLLLPKILARGAGVRVVNVSSNAYRMSPIRFEDVNFDVSIHSVARSTSRQELTRPVRYPLEW